MSAPDQELRELRALLQQALTKIDGLLGVPAGSGGADKEDDAALVARAKRWPMNDFVQSVTSFFDSRGFLTPKQRAALSKEVNRHGNRPPPRPQFLPPDEPDMLGFGQEEWDGDSEIPF